MEMGLFRVFLLLVIAGFYTSSSAPLEEAQFLRQIVKQYSPSLVSSFLHSRISNNQKMIQTLKKSFTDLDPVKGDLLDLARNALQTIDERLNVLEKADYFDFNGTDKISEFVEQFILINQFYPIDFGAYGMVNRGPTIEGVLEQIRTLQVDNLMNQTNTLIMGYLDDMAVKESSGNRLQKVSVSLMKTNLKSKLDQLNAIKSNNNNNRYNGYDANDPRRSQLDKLLRELKQIVDFFYSQFHNLMGNNPAIGNESSKSTETDAQVYKEYDVAALPTASPFNEFNH